MRNATVRPSSHEPPGQPIPILSPFPLRAFPIAQFRALRFQDGLFCPRCQGSRIQRWGRFGWRRRYRCVDCRRTFSDFTGTPLAYLKRVERWPAFCLMFPAALTVRDSARRLGLHKDTTFRWRRRLLASLLQTDAPRLAGEVSLGQTWFPFSEKGSRSLSRPPRRSRFVGFSSETRVEWVVLACDALGRSLGATVGPWPPRADELTGVLEGRVAPGSTIVSRTGRYGAAALAASNLGLGWCPEGRAWPVPIGCREAAPVMAWRLRRWMHRFCGVATRYLDEYLAWFRLVDLATGRTRPPRPLDPLLIGAFP